jgi:hypothetical protein
MTRILVIDDDIDVHKTIQTILKGRGFDIVHAQCGHGGVAAIEAFAVDAVLVDIFMPDMNGIETIRPEGPNHRHVRLRVPRVLEPDSGFLSHGARPGRDLLHTQAVQALGDHQGGRDVLLRACAFPTRRLRSEWLRAAHRAAPPELRFGLMLLRLRH